ncbi:MAG: ADP-ribosylglycohydrolase family protein [Bacilli bacterium]|nr:ADP-ribosylglycohydrolase family protein [Bacilli bacterium]
MRAWKNHIGAGFGGMFYQWCSICDDKKQRMPAYGSFGNGGPMRISPVAWVAQSEEELKRLSHIVTEITHDHIEGIKGAEAVALAVYLALSRWFIKSGAPLPTESSFIVATTSRVSPLIYTNILLIYRLHTVIKNS